jgi:hypothetical protein
VLLKGATALSTTVPVAFADGAITPLRRLLM